MKEMTSQQKFIKELITKNDSKIVLLVMDGVGDVPNPELGNKTPLSYAKKPNMDSLAKVSELGFHIPVMPGITPGSGPGHLGIFGYDPTYYVVGRGVLSALGVGFKLTAKDVAARINFATVKDGVVVDRRAGRIPDEVGKKMVELLSQIKTVKDPETGQEVEVFVRHVKEYRAVVIFRGDDLGGNITDTDPQKTGVPLLEPKAHDENDEPSVRTARIAKEFINKALEILKDQHPANAVMLRGFAKFEPFPPISEVYGLKAAAIATYPMYKGVASLVGMEVLDAGKTIEDEAKTLKKAWADYDFFYVHIKKTDSYGEDGKAKEKAHIIEETDSIVLPVIKELNPQVLTITGDHSTPALLKAHSWHPVPVLLHSKYARYSNSVQKFDEENCVLGTLGTILAKDLMPIMLAHAGRLAKFGA